MGVKRTSRRPLASVRCTVAATLLCGVVPAIVLAHRHHHEPGGEGHADVLHRSARRLIDDDWSSPHGHKENRPQCLPEKPSHCFNADTPRLVM